MKETLECRLLRAETRDERSRRGMLGVCPNEAHEAHVLANVDQAQKQVLPRRDASSHKEGWQADIEWTASS